MIDISSTFSLYSSYLCIDVSVAHSLSVRLLLGVTNYSSILVMLSFALYHIQGLSIPNGSDTRLQYVSVSQSSSNTLATELAKEHIAVTIDSFKRAVSLMIQVKSCVTVLQYIL